MAGTNRNSDPIALLVKVLIGVLCFAAALAILVVVSGNEWDDDSARAIGTAAALTLYMLCALAGRALAQERPEYAWFGWLTIGIAALGFILALNAIWNEGSSDGVWKAAGSLIALGLPSSHIALLLRNLGSAEPALAWRVRWWTIFMAGLLALLVVAAINSESGDDYVSWQAIAVVAILYVLGTVVLPLARRSGPAADPVRSNGSETVTVRYTAADGRDRAVTLGPPPNERRVTDHTPAGEIVIELRD